MRLLCPASLPTRTRWKRFWTSRRLSSRRREKAMQRFEPYGKRIVVQKIVEKERSGLLVPRDAQKRALIGRVLHVGPEVVDITPDQIVLFAQFSGCCPYMNTDLQKKYGEDILVMNDEDILCFVVDEPALVPQETAASQL